MASLLPCTYGVPNLVLIGVPDQAGLGRVLAKLKAKQIAHYAWSEPDFDYGLTAIATGPLTDEERQPLANYRLWNEHNSPGAPKGACLLTEDGGTKFKHENAVVAQLESSQ